MFLKTQQLKDDKAPAWSEILSSVSIKFVDQTKRPEQFRSIEGYTISMRNVDCVSDNIYCSLGVEQKESVKIGRIPLMALFLKHLVFSHCFRLLISLCISAGYLGILKDLHIFFGLQNNGKLVWVERYSFKNYPIVKRKTNTI